MSTIDDVRTAIDGALTAVSELDPEVAALNQRPGGVVEYKLTEARLWAAQLRTTTVGGLGSVDTGGAVAPADTSTDDPDPGPVKPDQPNANAGTGETTTTEPDPATAPVTLAASPTVTPEPDATAATATADESPDADPTKDVPVG